MSEPVASGAPEDEYPGTTVVGAALATFFFPLISLIVALLLMGQQRNERKRAQLRTSAIVSTAWIAIQVLAVVLLFAAVSAGSSSIERGGRSGTLTQQFP
jgi:hypothetical protein